MKGITISSGSYVVVYIDYSDDYSDSWSNIEEDKKFLVEDLEVISLKNV
jgi:hypothetical protein